jgi:RNA exonuclease 4
MQVLASTYAAPATGESATDGDELPAKRRKAAAPVAAVAAPVVVAAGQSNWMRLQKALPPPRGGSVGPAAGKPRRTPGPSEKEEAKEVRRKEKEKERAKKESGRGGMVLAEEMGAEYAGSCVACDCEMVGVGQDGKRSMLARVALVDGLGNTMYDQHVRAVEKVTDYRTHVSGIKASHIRKENGALPFAQVQREVAGLLEGRLLIGHAVHHDLKSMMLEHPRSQLRDTSLYPLLRSKDGRPRSLKHLAAEIGLQIQTGSHSPVEDALSTLKVYATVAKRWEQEIRMGTTPRAIHARKSDSQRRAKPNRPKSRANDRKKAQEAADKATPSWQADGRFSKFEKDKKKA